MADPLVFFTIATAAYGAGNWLVLDDSDTLYALGAALEASRERGRLAEAPIEIAMIAELEGQGEHYSEDEIRCSMEAIPLPYASESRTLLVVEPFVAALESVGAAFRARPVTVVHRASGRGWPMWLVTYVEEVYLPHLRDDAEPAFFDREGVTIAYYSRAARDAIAALGWSWMTFREHSLPRCTAAPIGDGPDADARLVSRLSELVVAKVPPIRVGSSYGADYFLDRLLTTYSDATGERVQRALERTGDASFATEWKDGVLDAIGVREDSALAKRLARTKKR